MKLNMSHRWKCQIPKALNNLQRFDVRLMSIYGKICDLPSLPHALDPLHHTGLHPVDVANL